MIAIHFHGNTLHCHTQASDFPTEATEVNVREEGDIFEHKCMLFAIAAKENLKFSGRF